MSNEIKFICVCRQNHTYNIEYINRLMDGFSKHTTVDVPRYCITNVSQVESASTIDLNFNWPGWWSKIELCRPDITGDIFYCDLDTIFRKNIDFILELCRKTDHPIMLQDFMKKNRLASGVMWLPKIYREKIWEKWITDPNTHIKNYKKGGDQAFISSIIGNNCLKWQSLLPKNSIVSLKVHCKKETPGESAIVCYHGNPRPHHIGWSEKFIDHWWIKSK
jgi:hypothetical protein